MTVEERQDPQPVIAAFDFTLGNVFAGERRNRLRNLKAKSQAAQVHHGLILRLELGIGIFGSSDSENETFGPGINQEVAILLAAQFANLAMEAIEVAQDGLGVRRVTCGRESCVR